ncbi:MAG: FAD-dependent oxidoreductase [Pseudomonadota bacterium]
MSGSRPHIVFAGAGHAALLALRALRGMLRQEAKITLISERASASYSGMVPGVIEGIYEAPALQIPLKPFARHHGIDLLVEKVVGASAQEVMTSSTSVPFDVLILNLGSKTRLGGALQGSGVIPAKPVPALLAGIDGVSPNTNAPRYTILGAGVAGIEVAFALRQRHQRSEITVLEQGPALLRGFPEGFVHRVTRHLNRARIDARCGVMVDKVAPQAVSLSDGSDIASDVTLAFTGAAPPGALDHMPFARAYDGFLAVEDTFQTPSHPNVFAVGDCATNPTNKRPKSGVFSVRSGPLVAQAVAAFAAGQAPQKVALQNQALVLLATGNRSAIGVRNGLVVEGRLVWQLKDWLDRSFVSKLTVPPKGTA